MLLIFHINLLLFPLLGVSFLRVLFSSLQSSPLDYTQEGLQLWAELSFGDPALPHDQNHLM